LHHDVDRRALMAPLIATVGSAGSPSKLSSGWLEHIFGPAVRFR